MTANTNPYYCRAYYLQLQNVHLNLFFSRLFLKMPAKAAQPKKPAKDSAGGSSGGKAKKKKWSKGKVRDKLNNMVSLSSIAINKNRRLILGSIRQSNL
jgi:hypothetical protein